MKSFQDWKDNLSPFKFAWFVLNVITILVCSMFILVAFVASTPEFYMILASCGIVMLVINTIIPALSWIVGKIVD